jgi:ABC-type lipoprotein release transport system permease subunit
MFALKYAYKSIIRRKRKNFITSLAIALGVALFIGAQAGSDGIINSMAKLNLDNIGNIDITITDPSSTNGLFNQNFTDLIDTNLSELNDINSISPRIIYTTSVYATETGLLEKGITVRGIQTGDTGFGEFEHQDGGVVKLEQELGVGEVIISDLLANELELSTDDKIQFSIPDGYGNSTTKKFTIAAIYDETKGRGTVGASPKDTSPQLYINLEELQSELRADINQSISEIVITFNGIGRSLEDFDVDGKSFPGKNVIKDAIQKIEEIYSNTFPGAFVFSARVSTVESMGDELALLTGFLTLFAIMLNATALLLIVNVQNMAVDDRKNQTAILRALGSSIGTIFAIFVIEAAIVGIVGALFGLILGYGVSIWMLSELSVAFGVTVSGGGFNPLLIIIALGIGVLLSIVTAVFPSLSAARQGIANTLRGLEEPKKPRKGIITLLFGIILLPLGLIFAAQVGNVFDEKNWETYGDQTTILLGFGLTLAGIGLILTLVLPRRLALSISGISMWGLGVFFTVVGNDRIAPGVPEDPGAWFAVILLYIVVGGTLLVSVNYEWLMNSISRMLFFIVGLRAISQVTTKQMIGKRSRGLLIVTILTVILFLRILISI